jgi:hypothetical protein
MKQCLLFASVALIVLLGALQIHHWREEIAFERQAEASRMQAEEFAVIERAREDQSCSDGTVWRGVLKVEPPSLVDIPLPIAAAQSLLLSQRIAGRLVSSNKDVTVEYDMHECHPGSQLCSTGGTIYIRKADRLLASISLSLLQSDGTGGLRSSFHVHWLDRSLDQEAKIGLFKYLASSSTALPTAPLGELLRSKYLVTGASTAATVTNELDESLLRTVLNGILIAVAPAA